MLVFNALKSPLERGRNPLGPPRNVLFSNFEQAWELGNFATTMRNSLILTLATIVGVWVISGLAAYALARLDVPGSGLVLLYLIVGSTLPFQLFIVPLFFLWVRLDLVDSLAGLIVIYWALFSPFATLLLRSFFVSVPKEIEEAARVDGAGGLATLTRIVLPLAWPGFLTVGLVTGLFVWNEFFFANTFISDESLKPVTTSFLAFQQRFTRDWGLTSAAALIMTLPVLALFLVLQRRFVAGLASGGLKV